MTIRVLLVLLALVGTILLAWKLGVGFVGSAIAVGCAVAYLNYRGMTRGEVAYLEHGPNAAHRHVRSGIGTVRGFLNA